MKIEIGESLISSYLSHVEGCRIVQTNWKTSSNWVLSENLKLDSESLFNKILSNDEFKDVFKNSSFDQFIKQAEIDVLGINTIESSVFAYDIAFHEAGLNYGDSLSKVLNKIIRSICVSMLYFSDYQTIHSLFVTPKCGQKLKLQIEEKLKLLDNIIDNKNIITGFVTNEDFYDKIFDTTINSFKSENNTAELFARALKLIDLDNRKSKQNKVSNKQVKKKTNSVGMKIGQYVRELFYRLNKEGKLSNNEIHNLQDPEYCKRTFNAGYPVLIKNTRTKEDHLGRVRYYKDEYIKGYWLSSQWYDGQKEKLKKWEKDVRL